MSQNRIILLIDYDPTSIQNTAEPLTRAGYRIEVRHDGESGLRAFHELSPALVLIEPMVPKKHGFQVCREIKASERGRRTPVMITTSFYRGRRHQFEAEQKYGCDDYLEKPIGAEQLLTRCRALMMDAPLGTADGEPPTAAVQAVSQPLAMLTGMPEIPVPDQIDRPALGALQGVSDEEIEASLDDLLIEESPAVAESGPTTDPLAGLPPLGVPVSDALENSFVRSSAPLEALVGPDDRQEAEAPALPTVAHFSGTPPAATPVDAAVSRRQVRLTPWPVAIALAAVVCLLAGSAILWFLRDASRADPEPQPVHLRSTAVSATPADATVRPAEDTAPGASVFAGLETLPPQIIERPVVPSPVAQSVRIDP